MTHDSKISEIGGQRPTDREVHEVHAPKRRGRPAKVASVAPMPTDNEIGANIAMTERSTLPLPQGGGSNPVATLPNKIGGQFSRDREVQEASAPKRRGRRAVASAAPLPVEAAAEGQFGLDREVHSDFAPKGRERREAVAPAPLPKIIDRLVMLQRERKFCIAMQSRTERSTEAFIARQLGYRKDLPTAEGKAIWKKASAIRVAAEGGEGGVRIGRDCEVHIGCDLSFSNRLIVQAAMSRAPWDEHRKDIEREMIGWAKLTPVWSWVSGIAGFGPKGLAIIIAEAGADLGNYSKREKLWKRLGLAVMDGKRQGSPGKGASAQDWIDHGYSAPRRAQIWTIADSLFKHQWAGDKDEDGKPCLKTGKPVVTPAHATGAYGEIYGARKERTAFSNTIVMPKHKDNDARRIMTKCLIEDLWRVWNGMAPRNRLLEPMEPRAEAA